MGLSLGLNLHRGGSIKDLISKFSGEGDNLYSGYLSNSFSRRGRLQGAASIDVVDSPGQEMGSATLSSTKQVQRPIFKEFDIPELREVQIPAPPITVPALKETHGKEPGSAETTAQSTQVEKNAERADSKAAQTPQTTDSGRDSVADSGMGSVSIKKRGGACSVTSLHEALSLILALFSISMNNQSGGQIPQDASLNHLNPTV